MTQHSSLYIYIYIYIYTHIHTLKLFWFLLSWILHPAPCDVIFCKEDWYFAQESRWIGVLIFCFRAEIFLGNFCTTIGEDTVT